MVDNLPDIVNSFPKYASSGSPLSICWHLFFHDFTPLPDIDAMIGTSCLDS